MGKSTWEILVVNQSYLEPSCYGNLRTSVTLSFFYTSQIPFSTGFCIRIVLLPHPISLPRLLVHFLISQNSRTLLFDIKVS